MTAQIAGFVSRAEAGLRKPRSFSRNITPGRGGGVAVHHGGGPQRAAEPNSDHARCVETWRIWQKVHMDLRGRGWVDIAYTGGFCNHGYAFAGRGAGVRTAANGTNAGNQTHYAVTWIGGEGQTPTQAAYDALDWWISELRKAGAGLSVKPHKFFKATGCPITALVNHASSRNGEKLTTPSPTWPTRTPPTNVVQRIQQALKVTADGKWGKITDARAVRLRAAARAKSGYPTNLKVAFDIKDTQAVIGTVQDGIWGPISQAALVVWIKNFQKTMGVDSDGKWGPKTDGRFIGLRRKHLNKF